MIIFIPCNGLNDAKATIIHHDEYKTLGIVNLDETANWKSVIGKTIFQVGGSNFCQCKLPDKSKQFCLTL